jgi:hypothetical protein
MSILDFTFSSCCLGVILLILLQMTEVISIRKYHRRVKY